MSSKIDRLVAERVMGWTLADRVKSGWGNGPDVYLTGNEDNPTYQGFEPSYSIETAWMVLEKLARDGWWFEFSRQSGEDGKWRGTITMDHKSDPEETRIRSGWAWQQDTAPMVISIMALRAVGVSESEIQDALK